MRVICIDDKAPIWTDVRFGEIYEVVGAGKNHCGLPVYFLKGKESITRCKCGAVNPHGGYKQSRFSPLSEIDETEFERNYNKQTV